MEDINIIIRQQTDQVNVCNNFDIIKIFTQINKPVIAFSGTALVPFIWGNNDEIKIKENKII